MRQKWVAVAFVLISASLALGALPPGYGGELQLPGRESARVPDPRNIRSSQQAFAARAVFDTLYTLEDGRVVPSLAAALPEATDEPNTWRIPIREGIRRHDRRTLTARETAISLRRADRSAARWWLSPIAHDDAGRLEVRDDAGAILIRTVEPTSPERVLASGALAIVVGRGVGTGPYRARIVEDELRLVHWRQALRGAPFIRQIHISAPASRQEELRQLELGELDASWRGPSLYGQRQSVELRFEGRGAPILLVPNPRSGVARTSWGEVGRRVDRDRLRRLGIIPTATLHTDLPPSDLPPGRAPSGSVRLLVREDDSLQADLAAALSARFDENGWRVSIINRSDERYDAALRTNGWDLRFAEIVPMLPAADAILAAGYAAMGQVDRAAEIWAASNKGEDIRPAARALGAVVLGTRREALHVRPEVRGLSMDELGRLVLERAHLPRSETVPE